MTLEEAQATLNLQTYIWQGSIGALIMGIVTSLDNSCFYNKKRKTIESLTLSGVFYLFLNGCC